MASFLALGRTRYDEPLVQLGTVSGDADTAVELARERHGEGLIELTLVPEADAVWVFRETGADE
jgi:hypothetical protein